MTTPLCCLTCRERLAHARGVCWRCYRRHCKAVQTGKATWADLEAAGLVRPAAPAGSGWRPWSLTVK
jgi:hypothetical protein